MRLALPSKAGAVPLDGRIPETVAPSDSAWRKELADLLPRNRKIAFVCIGTDRSTGDSLGPLVGMLLKEAGVPNVYGTLSDPIHASNFADRAPPIRRRHRGNFLVAIDACLAKEVDRVGRIEYRHEPLIPGAGVNRPLKPVGDACIVGYVNHGGALDRVRTPKHAPRLGLAHG